MRTNDEITTEHIEGLEADNDHLRAEIIALNQEILTLQIVLKEQFEHED